MESGWPSKRYRHHPDTRPDGEPAVKPTPVEPMQQLRQSSEQLLLGYRILGTGTTNTGQLLERTRRRQRRTLIGTHRSTSFQYRSPPFRVGPDAGPLPAYPTPYRANANEQV